jgi:hypothetical protein
MAAHDIDRSVAATAHKSWNGAVSAETDLEHDGHLVLDQRFRPLLIAFVQRATLDPNGIYLYLNPAPPISAPTPSKKGMRKEDPEQAARSKAEELEENEPDRVARIRVGAFGAIRRILGTTETTKSFHFSNIFDRNYSTGPVGPFG